jgi:hypothetical protein
MSLAIRLSCVTGLVLVAPIAAAEPLTTREILKALPGEWGWPEEGDAYDAHSCKSDPTQIWFENNDTIYKSRAPSMNGVLVSRVGIPASLDGTEPTEILISYLNLHQRGLFGQQVVWSLSMPDHDTIVWRAVPGGREVRPLVRCGAGDKVG